MFEVKNVVMVNAEGKRVVKTANALRAQAFNKIANVLADAGFEVSKAANGELMFPLVRDITTGDVYNIRLAVSLSNKPAESKVAKKAKAKAETEEMVDLFGEDE